MTIPTTNTLQKLYTHLLLTSYLLVSVAAHASPHSNHSDAEAADSVVNTMCMRMAKKGDTDELAFLVDKYNVDINASVNEAGETLLIVAAETAPASMIQFLLDQGADIEHRDDKGWTAFLNACYYNNDAAAQQLYDAGANTHAITTSGRNAVATSCAGENFNPELLLWLLQTGHDASIIYKNECTALASLARQKKCSPKLIHALVEHGAPTDSPRIIRNALQNNASPETIQTLLEIGVELQGALRVPLIRVPLNRCRPLNKDTLHLLVSRGATYQLNAFPETTGCTNFLEYGEQLLCWRKERNQIIHDCLSSRLEHDHALIDLLIHFADGSTSWIHDAKPEDTMPLTQAVLAADKQTALHMIATGAYHTEYDKLMQLMYLNHKESGYPRHELQADLLSKRIAIWRPEIESAYHDETNARIELLYDVRPSLPKDLARLIILCEREHPQKFLPKLNPYKIISQKD